MERHPFGMNFDEGLPLETNQDFDLLFVKIESSPLNRLLDWFQSKKEPLLFGGQIGSGKSTLIEKAKRDSNIKPDATIHFDYDSINVTTGGFLRLVLVELIRIALERNADLSFSNLPFELMPRLSDNDWKGLQDTISVPEVSLKLIKQLRGVESIITENPGYFISVMDSISKALQKRSGKDLFFIASGIDKFNTDTPEWVLIQSTLKFLGKYKTLFEVNSIHLLQQHDDWGKNSEKIMLTSCRKSDIENMLYKRLGNYAETRKDIIPLIAAESGGNPRQALRILLAHEYSVNKLKKDDVEAYTHAVRSVANDFFSFGKKPEIELLSAIDRTNIIESSLLNLPGDKETARTAVFGNWILLQSEPQRGIAWPAIVNPLVKKVLNLRLKPEEPEQLAFKKYAEQHQISGEGLSFDINRIRDGEFWKHYLSSILEQPISANIIEIMDILSAALLSKDRQDRVIIAYHEESVLEAARAYLFAKANSFEYQSFEHTNLDAAKDPLVYLRTALKKEVEILSFKFTGNWSEEQLNQLDKNRDLLLKKQIIWWIPFQKLSLYLSNWLHLRQLFQVFVLEDELLKSLSEDDIKADLEFFEDLEEAEGVAIKSLMENLKIVLNYLRKRKSA